MHVWKDDGKHPKYASMLISCRCSWLRCICSSACHSVRLGKLIWIASRHRSAGLLLHEHNPCSQKAPCCMWQDFREVLHSHVDMPGTRIQSLQPEFVDLHYRCSGLQLLFDQLDCSLHKSCSPSTTTVCSTILSKYDSRCSDFSCLCVKRTPVPDLLMTCLWPAYE